MMDFDPLNWFGFSVTTSHGKDFLTQYYANFQ